MRRYWLLMRLGVSKSKRISAAENAGEHQILLLIDDRAQHRTIRIVRLGGLGDEVANLFLDPHMLQKGLDEVIANPPLEHHDVENFAKSYYKKFKNPK